MARRQSQHKMHYRQLRIARFKAGGPKRTTLTKGQAG
jgi:hypothetical protein